MFNWNSHQIKGRLLDARSVAPGNSISPLPRIEMTNLIDAEVVNFYHETGMYHFRQHFYLMTISNLPSILSERHDIAIESTIFNLCEVLGYFRLKVPPPDASRDEHHDHRSRLWREICTKNKLCSPIRSEQSDQKWEMSDT